MRKDPSTITFSGDTLVADDCNQDLRDVYARARSLPKLVLTCDSSDQSSSSCETINSQVRSNSVPANRAVDSNNAIVTAFYVRNLLIKVLKSLAQFTQEQ
jgi:hypothetical protein